MLLSFLNLVHFAIHSAVLGAAFAAGGTAAAAATPRDVLDMPVVVGSVIPVGSDIPVPVAGSDISVEATSILCRIPDPGGGKGSFDLLWSGDVMPLFLAALLLALPLEITALTPFGFGGSVAVDTGDTEEEMPVAATALPEAMLLVVVAVVATEFVTPAALTPVDTSVFFCGCCISLTTEAACILRKQLLPLM